VIVVSSSLVSPTYYIIIAIIESPGFEVAKEALYTE